MSDNNVKHPVIKVLGFCDSVKEMLNTHKTAMITTGVDPTAQITVIGTSRDTLNTDNTAQESLKTQLHEKTALVDSDNTAAYRNASKGCDMLIAAFGNTSEVAKEARNLRKPFQHPKRKSSSGTTTPPAP